MIRNNSIVVFWVATLFSNVVGYHRFGGQCCLHLQGCMKVYLSDYQILHGASCQHCLVKFWCSLLSSYRGLQRRNIQRKQAHLLSRTTQPVSRKSVLWWWKSCSETGYPHCVNVCMSQPSPLYCKTFKLSRNQYPRGRDTVRQQQQLSDWISATPKLCNPHHTPDTGITVTSAISKNTQIK